MFMVAAGDSVTAAAFKPQRRRLSNYIGRITDKNNKMLPEKANEKVPIWLKLLLNDDIHTGQNVGAKLAYLCPGTNNGR